MKQEKKLLKLVHPRGGDVVVMIVWQFDLQLRIQSVPITTNVVSSTPAHGEMYSIQHYVIKFVSDLRQVHGFLRVFWFPPKIKSIHHNITEVLLKVALNTITLTLNSRFASFRLDSKIISFFPHVCSSCFPLRWTKVSILCNIQPK